MGWTGSSDPFAPIQLEFPDCESAISFAEKNGWEYQLIDPPHSQGINTEPRESP
jgi:hypothetical protein